MGHENGPERFLGWRQVRNLTGLGRTTVWRMRQAGDFPQPVPISPGRVAWRERDITAWNESRGGVVPMRVVERAGPPVAKPRPKTPPSASASPPQRTEARLARRSSFAAKAAEGQLAFDFQAEATLDQRPFSSCHEAQEAGGAPRRS